MKRKQSPSVEFNSWLVGEETEPIADTVSEVLDETPKEVKKEKPKVIKTENSQQASPARKTSAPIDQVPALVKEVASADSPAEKIKATYHIDTVTAERLDEIQYRLKQITGLRGHAISKSKIFDTIMLLAHEELKVGGEESQLSQALLKSATIP